MAEHLKTWITPGLCNSGWFPATAVFQRGPKIIQDVSSSHWIGAVVLVVLALAALIPIPHHWGFPYYAQIFVCLGLSWGAICLAAVPRVLQKQFGRSLVIDLHTRQVVITSSELTRDFAIEAVVALQLLKGRMHRSPCYELNLLYRNEHGELTREFLAADQSLRLIQRLAESYRHHLNWSLEDCSDQFASELSDLD